MSVQRERLLVECCVGACVSEWERLWFVTALVSVQRECLVALLRACLGLPPESHLRLEHMLP